LQEERVKLAVRKARQTFKQQPVATHALSLGVAGWPYSRGGGRTREVADHRPLSAVLESRLHVAATHFSKAHNDPLAFITVPRDMWRQIWSSNPQESGRSSPQLAGALPERGERLGTAVSPPPAACGGLRLPLAGRLDRQLVLEHLAVKLRFVRPPGKRPHGQMELPVPIHGEPRRIGQHDR
jgi:hypothetical protein